MKYSFYDICCRGTTYPDGTPFNHELYEAQGDATASCVAVIIFGIILIQTMRGCKECDSRQWVASGILILVAMILVVGMHAIAS